jgi:para-nitrobenzyl esterase
MTDLGPRLTRAVMAAFLVVVLCGYALTALGGCAGGGIVSAPAGKIRGQVTANGVVAFKGIPYAAPPVGDLRFQPPQPAKPWSGTLRALDYGKAEIQPRNAIAGTAPQQQSEDCLFLNVWAPKLDSRRRPVMVWIHGGGFKNGSGSDPLYDGSNLARRGDVDVVTINYRLGPFGFLYLGGVGGTAYAQSGNLGLLDQVAAVKWVRDNIGAFGGDPSNVTIFGESAGGMSVCALLGMPEAKGLFRHAIAESGAANMVRDTATASVITSGFMTAAGATDVNALKALSARQMVAAESKMVSPSAQSEFVFGPVVDGAALPQPPLQTIAAVGASGVDLMIGTNHDEIRLWTLAAPAVARLPLGVLASYIPTVQGACNATAPGSTGAVAASYQSRMPGASDGDVSMAVLTDSIFRVPSIRVAEAQSPGQSNTWMYMFSWPSPETPSVGACHAIELPFVFGNFNGQVERLVGTSPPQALSNTIQDAWAAFARTGNPNKAGVPAWKAYETGTRATMVFNTTTSQQDDPAGQDRLVWNGVPFDGVVPPL